MTKEKYFTVKNVRDYGSNFCSLHDNIILIIAVVMSSMLCLFQMTKMF
jgi:hypothetical protein